MACTINFQFVPIFQFGVLNGFQVSGVVIDPSGASSPPGRCDDLVFNVTCGATTFTDQVKIHWLSTNTGTFAGFFANPPAGLLDCCGEGLSVSVGCASCGWQTYTMPFDCTGVCPILTGITAVAGPCQFDGAILISASAHVYVPGAQATLQWTLDGTAVGAAVVISPTTPMPLTTTIPVSGDGQNHVVRLTVIDPSECASIAIDVLAPKCGGCTPVKFDVRAGECKKDGTREVTYTAILIGASAATQISAQMTGPGSPVNGAAQGSLTLTGTAALAPGAYTITVTAGNCPPQTHTFNVDACCPEIAFNQKIGDCNFLGQRDVIYSASLTASAPITMQMSGPFPTQSVSGTGSMMLTSAGVLPPGTYNVTITAGNCPPKTHSLVVESCCPSVQFQAVVCGDPECRGKGTRPVHITASVQPDHGLPTTAHLKDAATGTVLASGSGTTPFTLTADGDYPEGSHDFVVSFEAPSACPDRTFSFCVPKCESAKCFALHTAIIIFGAAFVVLSVLPGIAALAAYLSYVAPALGPALQNYPVLSVVVNLPQYLYALLSALALFVLCFIQWAFCIKIGKKHVGNCCSSKCMIRVIVWQITLMAAAILAYLVAACLLLMAGSALFMFAVALFMRWRWEKKCCTGKCDKLYYTSQAWDWALSATYVFVFATGVSAAVTSAPAWFYLLSLAALAAGNIIKFNLQQEVKRCLNDC